METVKQRLIGMLIDKGMPAVAAEEAFQSALHDMERSNKIEWSAESSAYPSPFYAAVYPILCVHARIWIEVYDPDAEYQQRLYI